LDVLIVASMWLLARKPRLARGVSGWDAPSLRPGSDLILMMLAQT
jgi:hypothetical protein